jgi:hypothetical protein
MSEIIAETISYLIENVPSTEYSKKLHELISTYQLQKDKIDKTKEINHDIKEKIKTTFDFLNFVKTICKTAHPSIFGSFVRMLFERSFTGLSELDGYGNTINHDIDLYLYEEKYDFIHSDFKTLINVLQLMKSNMTFGDYKIDSIHDKTISDTSNVIDNAKERMLNVPHYVVILKNDEKIIKYDLLAYKIESTNTWTNEFDINSLKISRRGIHCDQSFFDTIINIINRTAQCTIDFKKLILPLSRSGYRSKKVKIFNDILFFASMRTKILSLGYKQIYNDTFGTIILSIEKDNDCPITSLQPPYIQLELECNHKCSLMALAGIINIRASSSTESISCPFCRHTLIPKIIITTNPNKLKKYSDGVDTNSVVPVLPPYEICEEIITRENRNYITGLMYGLTPQQVMSGRIPVSDYDLVTRH